MTAYVVGDIQGCLQPLQQLLQQVQFDPQRDRLLALGDLVNRGPESLACLRFLRDLGDSQVCLLGNHDLHLLAVAEGLRQPHSSDTLDEILNAPDRDELLLWLRHRPLMHYEPPYTLVHAGIPPQWSVADARRYASEVEDCLRGAHYRDFLGDMYGNEPALWREQLRGTTRLRVITNYLTRMRHCDARGTLDLVTKGPTAAPGGDFAPWFKQRRELQPILFGHWASLEGHTDSPHAIALDTGCVWGGRLTLMNLDDGSLHSCPGVSGL